MVLVKSWTHHVPGKLSRFLFRNSRWYRQQVQRWYTREEIAMANLADAISPGSVLEEREDGSFRLPAMEDSQEALRGRQQNAISRLRRL
jgi:hypothetical protein